MLPMPTRFRRASVVPAVILGLAACGQTSHADLTPRPLAGLPERFLGAGEGRAGMACRTPLRDPSNGVVLTLVRSGSERINANVGWGDYSVSPEGSYGIGADQLLRVECGSGRPAGTVKR
jgi:hypothetical protein